MNVLDRIYGPSMHQLSTEKTFIDYEVWAPVSLHLPSTIDKKTR